MMDNSYTKKCKQCLEYFETDDSYEDYCSGRCRDDYEYAYEDDERNDEEEYGDI